MARFQTRRLTEPVIEAVIRLAGVSAIVFVFGIFFFVFREGADFLFGGLSWRQFLTSTEWYPTSVHLKRYGALALIAGTAAVTALSMAVAVPFGIGAAVFLSEFSSPRWKEGLKIVIELLARHPIGGLGLHRPHDHEQRDHAPDRGADRLTCSTAGSSWRS